MGNLFETITEWILGLLSLVTEGIFRAIMAVFAEAFMSLGQNTESLLQLQMIQNVISYGKIIAVYLLVLKLLYDLVKIYQLQIEDGADSGNPLTIVRDGGLAVIVIYNVDSILNEIYKFGTNLVSDIVNINQYSFEHLGSGIADDMVNGINGLSGLSLGTLAFGGIFFLGLMIVLGLLLLVIVIQMAIRKAELVYYQVIAPFLAVNFSSPSKELWGILIKSVVTLSVTQAIQIVMIFLIFECLKEFNFIVGFFYAFGFAWVALKTPQSLKQFVHSTGVGGGIGGLGRMASQRMMFRGMKK